MRSICLVCTLIFSVSAFASETKSCQIGGHLRGWTYYGVDRDMEYTQADSLEQCIEAAKKIREKYVRNVVGEKLRIKFPQFIFTDENGNKIEGKISIKD